MAPAFGRSSARACKDRPCHLKGLHFSFARLGLAFRSLSHPRNFTVVPVKPRKLLCRDLDRLTVSQGACIVWEGVCSISQNLVASDLVAVQRVTSVRQGEKQSTICQALLSALQKHIEEKSSGWARCRFSEGRGGAEHGSGWLSLLLIQEKQIRQNLGPGLFGQILFIRQ